MCKIVKVREFKASRGEIFFFFFFNSREAWMNPGNVRGKLHPLSRYFSIVINIVDNILR